MNSTKSLERLNGESQRRAGVVGIVPDAAAVSRLVGLILLEQNPLLYRPRNPMRDGRPAPELAGAA